MEPLNFVSFASPVHLSPRCNAPSQKPLKFKILALYFDKLESEKPVLLTKKGEIISTVEAYNAKVADDVLEGLEEQGHYPMGSSQAGN